MLKDHPHAKTIEQIFEEFQTKSFGLEEAEVKKRQERFGANTLPEGQKTSPISIFFRQFKNLMVVVLAAAAILSGYYGHWLDVGVIIAVIAINSIIGFVQEYRAEKAINALKNLVVPQAKVKRNDIVFQIPAKELVPGDILIIEEGDRIPADARIINCKNLQVSESLLTGESLPVNKITSTLDPNTALADRKNMLFAGSIVVHGNGEAVIVAIGTNTFLGKIAKGLLAMEDSSGRHFMIKNQELVKQMSAVAFGTAIITFLTGYFLRDMSFQEILTFSLAALVAGIPESLPIIIIVVLSISAHRMAQKKAIIRTLPATETLSVVDVIITDKTGTITQNQMEVAAFALGTNSPIPFKEIKDEKINKLLTIARYSNNVRIKENQNGNEEILLGDPTEKAFFSAALKFKDKTEELNKIDDIPFDQNIKARGAIVENRNGEFFLFVTGAPESVLAKSSIKKNELEKIEKNITLMTNKAMRTIGFAWKKLKSPQVSSLKNIDNLTWEGAMGMIDPPRPESKMAIKRAKNAGIRVIMATGDHPKTALAIAREIGLYEGNSVYTAVDIEQMTDENLLLAAKETNVFARMTPDSKLRLLEVLQKAGYTVAMTGDGVNDAPALKKADIGIAMGKGGTDVARESSDIVLADDNFATIVTAIEEGRTQFRNIRRTSFFLVTTNFAQSASLISFLLAGLPLPLLPKQILWINLVGSGVTDIALATEPIHDDVLSSPPRSKNEKILGKSVLPLLLLLTITMAFSALIAYFIISGSGETKTRTAIFVLLSLMQIINMFNMRSLRRSVFEIGFFTNKNINFAFIISIALLLAVIYIPSLAKIFEFEPLSILEMIWLTALSSSVLWLGELTKRIKNSGHQIYQKV